MWMLDHCFDMFYTTSFLVAPVGLCFVLVGQTPRPSCQVFFLDARLEIFFTSRWDASWATGGRWFFFKSEAPARGVDGSPFEAQRMPSSLAAYAESQEVEGFWMVLGWKVGAAKTGWRSRSVQSVMKSQKDKEQPARRNQADRPEDRVSQWAPGARTKVVAGGSQPYPLKTLMLTLVVRLFFSNREAGKKRKDWINIC